MPAASADKTRLALVEDEDLYRDLLRIALSGQPQLEVVASLADPDTALREIPPLQPHVVILDIELRGPLNGIQLGLRLRSSLPELGIVLLSNHGDPEFVASLPPEVLSGWSYLLKRSVSDVAVLSRAIQGAAHGELVLDEGLVAGRRAREGGAVAGLTPRQRDILGLIAQGFSNAAIAERLTLAEKSVQNQINLLYQQLGIEHERTGVHPRVKAVLAYLQQSRPGTFL